MTKIEEQVDILPSSETKKEKKKKRKRELAMQDDISNQIDQIQDFIDSNKKKKRSESAKKFTIKLSEDLPSEKAKKSKSNDDSKELPRLNKGKGPKMIVAQDNSNKTNEEQKSKKLTKKEKLFLMANSTDHETKGQIEALSYLKLWKSARNSWKFNTNRQSWLVKNALLEKRICDSDFDVLLEYFKGLKGNIRELAKTNAKKRLEVSLLETTNESTENANKTVVDPGRKRAKQILEILSNDS